MKDEGGLANRQTDMQTNVQMDIAQWEFAQPNLDLPNNEARSEVSA